MREADSIRVVHAEPIMSSKRLHLTTGDIVFREGDPPTSAYLVESGQIEILTVKEGMPMGLSVLGPGDLLGEMAVIAIDLPCRRCVAAKHRCCAHTPIRRHVMLMATTIRRWRRSISKHSCAIH